jgi:UDP-glucuronate 4-epimerase
MLDTSDDPPYFQPSAVIAGDRQTRRRRRLAADKDGSPDITTFSNSWEMVPVVDPVVGKKKVLVTGAAGFIGSHVADYLLARGDEVVVVDEVNDYYDVSLKESNLAMLEDKYGTERLTIYRGDICDEELMTMVFEEEKPDFVCHLAARAGVRPSIQDPAIYVHSNVEGTVRLLELAVKYNVKNFVMASSSSVYGGSTSTYFSEEDRVDLPISPYAASKKSAELIAYTYHHLYGLNVTALRFFTVYGPRGRPDMAPFMFVDKVSRGVALQQFGDGSSSRDYTYIDDIVNGVVRAVDRPYPYQIFNLGKGSGTKLSEFISLVEKHAGRKAVVEVLPDQPGDVPYTCADIRKAERLLGYRSTVPFEEGIRRTVEWYQETYGSDTGVPVDEDFEGKKTTEAQSASDEEVSGEESAEQKIEGRSGDTESTENFPSAAKKTSLFLDEGEDSVSTSKRIRVRGDVDLFPTWLKTLASVQWFIVVTLLGARLYMKNPSLHARPPTPPRQRSPSSQSSFRLSPSQLSVPSG